VDRLFFGIACVSAGIAVALGAFAAHGLRQRLVPDMLTVFEIGVRYQMYHALALFVAGTLVFSGTLYLLAVSGQRWLGAVTPLGGLAFIAGWLLLAWALWSHP
jgi:uncharacterized membrane protein YgdD (TMEM256/DUF423 family)